jgi:hypothetical protein
MANLIKWKGLDVDPSIISESASIVVPSVQIDTTFNESKNEGEITAIYPKIEAIHAGTTKNFNRYPQERLRGDYLKKSGVHSWTSGYAKPIIFNHDTNTECVGRVHSASFSETTLAGRPGIILVPKITDKTTIEKINDGRLLTVSIGASTDAAVCSICGTDIINEGFCGHWRGDSYEGQTCEWICGELFFNECSFVNVPADSDAMIVQTDTSAATGTRESIQINTGLTENNQMVTTEEDNHSEPKEEPIVTKQIKNPATNPTENNEPANTDTPKTVEELEAEVAELQAQLETAQADLTTAQAELTTAQEKVTDLTAKVEESEGLTQQVQELTVKNEELTNANESLVKDLHNATVEFLVDVKVAFNQESDREQAKEKFASRTLESLRDAINDALQTKPAVRESVRVEPPAGTTVNTESTPANKSLEEQYEEVLVKLFSGNKR